MKHTYYFIILCVFLFTGKANARQRVSETEAIKAAINTLQSKTDILKKSHETEIKTVNNFRNANGDILMYEVVFQNGASILLSGSKACLPVLGYSVKNRESNISIFDTNEGNVPDGLKALLNDYAKDIEWCLAQDTIKLSYQSEWNELQQPNYSKNTSKATTEVRLNLTTKWGQSSSNSGGDCHAYNYYVTKTGGKKCDCEPRYCPAGCTSVAIAQVMNYWKYPVYMPGSTYQYDWCNMRDELNTYSPNYEKERNAVARLIRDCGEASNTQYCILGSCASSATLIDAKHAFRQHFNYNVTHRLKSSYLLNKEKWKEFIRKDIDNGRPVIYYSLGTKFDGHTWICDGYNSDDQFHFNWGWRGNDDDWYALDALKDIDGSNYNQTQEALFEIYPNENQNFCNFTLPLLMHYILGGTHQNVPKTFMMLESVPNPLSAAWRTIPAGSNVIYEAHKSIKLNPGFKVEVGASFKAQITPCERCD